MTVHFICNGNIFRSIIAEAYLKSLSIPNLQVTSSGTMAASHWEMNKQYQPGVQQVLRDHGILAHYKATPDQLTQQRTDNQDVTICLNAIARANASRIVQLPENTIIWDIADIGEGSRISPNGDRTALSEDVFNEIKQEVDNLAAEIRKHAA